jgi:hypothetical protein
MTDTAATFHDVTSCHGRILPLGGCRLVIRFLVAGAAIGLATVAAACALVTTVTMAAAWIVNTALATNPHLNARTPAGPASIALAEPHPMLASAHSDQIESASDGSVEECAPGTLHMSHPPRQPGADFGEKCSSAADFTGSIRASAEPPEVLTFAAKWARAMAPASAPTDAEPLVPPHPVAPASNLASLQPPAQAVPQLAAATPEKRVSPQPAHNKSMPPPEPDGHTAVYDIAAHTVYLPNGERLEAHSGLGNKLDDPRYVGVKDRGPTPPNVYDLALREQPFHEVRALRLNPVGAESMFGRDGILAHSYMLGASGQSNGCVSFKDYPAFLHAYLRGEVDRLVVVPHLGDTSWRTASARRGPAREYPDNNP